MGAYDCDSHIENRCLIDKLLAARLAPELPRNADCFDHK